MSGSAAVMTSNLNQRFSKLRMLKVTAHEKSQPSEIRNDWLVNQKVQTILRKGQS